MAKGDVIISEAKYYRVSYEVNSVLDVLSAYSILSLKLSYHSDIGFYPSGINKASVTITPPDGDIINLDDGPTAPVDRILYKLKLTLGTYKIHYKGVATCSTYISGIGSGTTYSENYSFYYIISVVENKLPLKKWSITDVINRTLDLAEPIRKGEMPRFRLNTEQAEQFDKIPAPEFSFTKQTLRECLQEVGHFIHGEPRLTPKNEYKLVKVEHFDLGTAYVGSYPPDP